MRLSKAKIDEYMQKQNVYTFTELAHHIGITKNQLSTMLSSSYNPIKSRTQILCDFLNVSLEDIVEKNDILTEVPIKDDDITSIELFAGAGGLALGFEQAGIQALELVEIDKYCCSTLRNNRPNWNVVFADIHTIDFAKYKGKVDVVSGGFPCQAFSYAGRKLGFEDVRGTLFYEFARCIKEVNPLMFVAENVRGLISHDNGRTLQTILDVFESLGYTLQTKIMNAAFYGVGQKRERIVIVGVRNDTSIEFEYPKEEERMTTLKEALHNCPISTGVSYSDKKKQVLDLVPPGGCWIDLPDEIAKTYMGKSYYSGGGKRGMARRIAWDEPCLTLTCSPSQKQTERCHPDETRPFTVREYARIQSFPDDWKFEGGIGAQYKQIGNAVPVEMARRIGVECVKSIQTYKKQEGN